jgi:hypothetical protein
MNQIKLCEHIELLDLVTLHANVIKENNLFIDLWEKKRNNNNYGQIFIQLNNVKYLGNDSGNLKFDVSNENIILNSLDLLESKCADVMENFLANIERKKKLRLNKFVKNKKIIEFKSENDDYQPRAFDYGKKEININDMESENLRYNIIFEVMGMELNTERLIFRIKSKLRLTLVSTVVPKKIKLTSVDNFITSGKISPCINFIKCEEQIENNKKSATKSPIISSEKKDDQTDSYESQYEEIKEHEIKISDVTSSEDEDLLERLGVNYE